MEVNMLRLFCKQDYDAVFNLWQRTEGMGLRSLDDSYEGIEKFLKRNPTTNFVYEMEEKIVGAILCGHDGRRAYIYHAVVDSDFRGRGIGKELVDAVIESLRAIHIHKSALVVFKDNGIGNGFWESYGYKKRDDLIYRDFLINEKND